jgi:ABC-type multidrug transport system ATPase subunit
LEVSWEEEKGNIMKISNLSKKYNNFHFNWQRTDCFEKKIYGIIGANGCGKTTFLKILSGLVRPDTGTIDYENLTPRDITMVFRKPYLMQGSVYQNLIYPLSIRKIEPNQEKVDYYLEMAGLKDMKNQYAPSLSSGEQQKLSLIRALIFSPKVILIDETFCNMDIESVITFEEYILKSQKEQPITWFIISHQLSNIKHLCDWVYFLHKGNVETCGTALEVLHNPKNPHLQKFLHCQAL